MLDLDQLRVLGAVATSGSMTAAASELGYTPSAVSQQMAALERRVGAPLLVRHARGVRLTDAGRLLVERSAMLDDQLRRLEQDIDDLLHLRAGRLRIGAFASAATRIVPTAIERFRAAHPEVVMSLDVLDPLAGVAAAREGRVDLAVVFELSDDTALDTGELDVCRLGVDPMYVAVPADRALPAHLSVADLRDEPWIRDCGADPACRELLGRLCRAAGFAPKVAFESDTYLAIGRLVAAGVGVALVPGFAAEQMPPSVALRPLRPAVERRLSALTPAGAAPAAQHMARLLCDVAAEVEGELEAGADPTVGVVRRVS